MLKVDCTLENISLTLKGDYNLVFTLSKTNRKLVDKFAEEIKVAEIDEKQPLTINVKKKRNSRSLDSNRYLWVLCGKIAEKLNMSSQEVYQQCIRQVGVFDIIGVKESAVSALIEKWGEGGIGNFAEDLGTGKTHGINNVKLYYGSSTYDSKEMTRLIAEVIENAKALGIETLTPNEISLMNNEWRKKEQ